MDKELIRFLLILCLVFVSGFWIPLLSFGFIYIVIGYIFEYVTGKHPVQKGKTAVVITGCSTGIGKSAAVFLAKKGVIVFASVRKQEDAERLKKEDKNIIPFFLEVTNSDQIKQSVLFIKNKVESQGLHLIGILNNAARPDEAFIESTNKKRITSLMDINCLSQIEVTSAFLPLLRQHRSPMIEPRVVFTSSVAAWCSLSFNGPYSGTKRGLEGMCDSLRQEVKGLGIKVILIEPGSIKTEIFNNVLGKTPKEEEEQIKHLDDVARRHYTEMLPDCLYLAKNIANQGASTSFTDEAVDKAFFGVYPSPRYLVGYDAILLYYLQWLPESITDYFIPLARIFIKYKLL